MGGGVIIVGMLRWTGGVLALLGCVLTGCGAGQTTSGEIGPGGMDSYVRVSPRDNRYFELTDGSPFIPIGLNIAFPRFLYDEEPVFQELEERMRKLSGNGGNFIRIWMSHPFYDVEHEYSGKYDSIKVRRIDRVLSLAHKYKIRVKMTLEHFRTLDESPPEFAGAVSTGKPLHHIANGGSAADMTGFFTLESSKARFKRKLAWFAKRYRDEPVVFAWELWNEINAVHGEGWEEWTREMLAELHAQFPHHLAVQSLGSLDMHRKQSLFEPIWKMEDNDFAQVHRYLDPGAELEVCKGPADVMAADAVRSVLGLNVNKPVVLAESGAVEAGHAGPSILYARDRLGVILHDIIFAPFFSGSAGTGQSWHWHFYVDRNNLWHHYGRFADVVRGVDPPAEGFQPMTLPHERLRVYVLRGRKTTLIWCRDSQAGWRQDLEKNDVPTVREAALDLNAIEGGRPPGRVRLYSPWSGEWTNSQVENGALRLPAFLRSIVVRIDS